jgi:SulP family sulfate permease
MGRGKTWLNALTARMRHMTGAGSDDTAPQIDLPGQSRLRDAVANWRGHLPGGRTLRRDGVAGLSLTAANVPDGMANAVLVGVNPLYGLYAAMVGPLVGGLLSSTPLMVVTTTAAASLTAGEALGGFEGDAREAALFLMVVLVGVFQVLFGVLGFGRLTRFVSYSVMTGFLMGVGVLIILSQLPNAAGYAAQGANSTLRFFDLLLNLNQAHSVSFGVALLTLALAVTLPRTRLGNFGILVAIAVPSALVMLAGLDGVRTVSDVGEITGGLPALKMPSFPESINAFTGAFAVAVVIVVQAAGVSQSVPNPDGSRPNPSRDFTAMGAANTISGFLHGLPVGGSLSATALGLLAGAGSRWASIFAGLWMALIVILFPQAVSPIAMPSLAALLMLAGARTLRLSEARSIWNTGWPSRLAIVTTFLAMLFLPVQAAVGIGVVLSALLYLSQSSTDVSVVERIQRSDGRVEEHPAPDTLPSNAVTVLHVYGNLFYAGARTLERKLPSARGTRHPVVVLDMRGQTHVGATLLEVLTRYVDGLKETDGRLYLSGLSRAVHSEIIRTAKLDLSGPVQVYEAQPVVGQSTEEAVADANAWLVSLRKDE